MIKRIILVFLCIMNMMTITMFSTQNAEKSTKVSEGITVKVVTAVTDMPEPEVQENIRRYDKYTRSFAHFALFMSLGILLYLTMKSFNARLPFLYACAICFVYAVFDELYQKFFSHGRAFEMVDLLKDWAGSLTGIFASLLISRIITNNQNKSCEKQT